MRKKPPNLDGFSYLIIILTMAKKTKDIIIPDEIIMNKIAIIRGQKVMLDREI